MKLLLFHILVNFLFPCEYPDGRIFTVDSVGACQGVSYINGKIYLYGDREKGMIREYQLLNDSLVYTKKEIQLTLNNKDLISHPTGLALINSTVFIGNSTRRNDNSGKWDAFIFCIDWNKLQAEKTLDNSLIRIIEDDEAVQGTRPEYVEYNGKGYIATADYGGVNNEVRFYDINKLKNATKTSEPGVLATKFRCGPWVQNLHWIKDRNMLVLVQNQIEGRKWRLSFVDIKASVESGNEKIISQIDFENEDELEGFCMLNDSLGIAVSSSRRNNVFIFNL